MAQGRSAGSDSRRAWGRRSRTDDRTLETESGIGSQYCYIALRTKLALSFSRPARATFRLSSAL
jgi:hypothetical protein